MTYLSQDERDWITESETRAEAEDVARQIYFRRQEGAPLAAYEEVTTGVLNETNALVEELFGAKKN